ncbi:MAG TPA: glycosyltransferase family 2 protein, partial [Candidatus Kapabacteria bacterium]|nr:glycosyltransferase family 2 protein [Candidatus Kapabacteria bacterium]
MEGVLEYDNVDDRSFEHPRQPILDVWYYHLARIRGFNFEYSKRKNYEKFTHPLKQDWEIEQNVRMNQWVHGLYPMEKIDVPDDIPTKIIPNPKVSIIIPCYNKAKWIGEAIESCLNQTHKPYEIIVIDDGSTDNSRDECERYAGRISYFRQNNVGVSESRNRGLDKATGDYFILLDADDKLAPNYIEGCLEEMKGDTQICYTDFIGLGEWEGIEFKQPEPEQIRTAQVIPSTMALCDMRILDPYGNFKDIKTFEDAEFWLNCYYNRKMNFKHIPEPLCYYRRTQGSRIDYLNETKESRYKVLNDMYRDFNVEYK